MKRLQYDENQRLVCPACGNTSQFLPVRGPMKWLIGVLARRTRLRCLGCGRTYKRRS